MQTWLFCAWLAWSRFRVVIPTWDKTLPTLIACIDPMLRALRGGADLPAHRQRADGDAPTGWPASPCATR